MARKLCRAVSAAAALYLITAPGAQAGEKFTARGDSLFVPKTTESHELSGGRTLVRNYNAGFITADPPDNPVNRVTQDCTGTTVLEKNGKSLFGSGYCFSADSDGHMYWTWWRDDAGKGTWGYQGGTGKFEGIKGGGTWKAGAQWPDGKFLNTWEGTWEMK